MSLLYDALAGVEATAAPVAHLSLVNGVTNLLLAGARVVTTADVFAFHVSPRAALNTTFEFFSRLTNGIPARSSKGSGDSVACEGRQASLFACLIQELLDVILIIPFNDIEFVSLEELFDDREEVLP